ncbi:PREDICTED: uncharacterized protein LOC108556969 [Nicrophorus vespilloides]|uniref:Uncharacterized protein LOC108556969 n=1 Tax=Nicrophorus vespilloides TaxID=110193 RepID=A0ABM1M2L8_NICVS|nr:PREDICTED: uncharacterized protein LOC108556969 [Nicrophorus vespilloides]
MAEHVQIHMERMVEEFEEMARTEIFSDEEIRVIKNKRENFENKVCGMTSHSLLGFRSYIEFEYNIYKLIKARRSKLKQGEKIKSIDQKILKRVANLYLRAIKLYPEKDIELYFDYFNFCHTTKYVGNVAHICSQLIQCHSKNENAWLTAAQWYMYSKHKNVDLAIKTLQKGIVMIQTSKVLYKKCIQFELAALEKNSDEEAEALLNKKINIYFEDIVSKIPEVQFYVDIFFMLKNYAKTVPAQLKIVEYLQKNHSDKAVTWHVLAENSKREEPEKTFEEKLGSSITNYKEGLEKLESEEKAKLWNYYLNSLHGLCKKKDNLEIIKPVMVNAFKEASNENVCTESHYINWLNISTDVEGKEILEMGTKKLPNSVDLWLLRLRFCILSKDDKMKVVNVFESGVEALKSDSFKLWLTMSDYYPANCDEVETEDFFRGAIKEFPVVFKVKYIEWLAQFKTIDECREAYRQMKDKPYSKELFLAICNIEMKQSDGNYVEWEKVYAIACAEFGKNNIDIWLNYIRFYMFHNKVSNAKECIFKVMEDAKKNLNDDLYTEFKRQFDDLYEEYCME